MNLNVLKSTVHFSKWRDSVGAVSLSLDVVPQGHEYIEIGDQYLFSSRDYARILGKDRTLIGASLRLTQDPDVLTHLSPKFEEVDRPILGWAGFYPERHGNFDSRAAELIFTLLLDKSELTEILRVMEQSRGEVTIDLGIDGLVYGQERDGSHLIWELDEANYKRPISTFSYSVEQLWTSERAVSNENECNLNAASAECPDTDDREFTEISDAEQEPDPILTPDPILALVKRYQLELVAILILGFAVVVALIT